MRLDKNLITTLPVVNFDVEGKLPPDFFVSLFPLNSLMLLLHTVLIISVITPETYSIIPGLNENTYAEGGKICAIIFAISLFFNLFMTNKVIKLCEKHQLNSSTTIKWIIQTLVSGFLSWRALRDADTFLRSEFERRNLDCLLGPFFLRCEPKELTNICGP